MSLTINRVRRMADLPDDIAENVRNWPHYPATSETHPDDRYSVTWPATKAMPEHTDWWDPLTTENGERGIWRITGYAEAGTTSDGYRLFVLRVNASTFIWAYMSPGSTSLNIAAVTSEGIGTKATVEAWVADQLALDLAPATEAGTIAYNVGRPNQWDEHVPGGWGARRITDERMGAVVEGRYGLARMRLSRAYSAAWEANAAHDRDRAAKADADRRAALRNNPDILCLLCRFIGLGHHGEHLPSRSAVSA